jgi:glycosyltransferase involved in cell wall biosynthesis
MNIVHLINSVGPLSFGLGPVAVNLAKEQIALGEASSIWCLDDRKIIEWAAKANDLTLSAFQPYRPAGPGMLGLSFTMEKAARTTDNATIDIVHQHCIWTGISRVTNLFRRSRAIPTVIALHGTLEKPALQRSAAKKKIASWMYENENLHNASCLHASSEQEVAGFRDYGLKNPIAVIPHGISDTWLKSEGDAEVFRRRHDLPSDKRIMLFLSRITPVKGLPMLIEAMDLVRNSLHDWILVIAGSDQFGHQREVQALLQQYRLQEKVKFVGLLVDQEKRDAFAVSDLFVLPTERESLGIVVLEALGANCPVLTTKGAPWEELVKHKCGWWTEITSRSIADSLKDALCQEPPHLKMMGEAGRKFIESEYRWDKSAQMTIELYDWLLGRGERPEFVIVR